MPIEPDDSNIGDAEEISALCGAAVSPPESDIFAIPRYPLSSAVPAKSSPRRAAPRRRPAVSSETAPGHHALYRLFDKAGVLLYVGETNNPVERYIEHRDEKDWWPDVARHSIVWSTKGRARVQEAEAAAIKDEWPLYNIAYQPRGGGTYFVPSYVVDKILDAVRQAVGEVITNATEKQADAVARTVFDAFTPRDDEETGICGYGEIGFPFGGGPQPEPLDLDAVLDAMGPFRPDIDNSMRVGQPRKRSWKLCEAPSDNPRRRGKCGGRLRRNGSCPHPERHTEAADAVDAT